ncbi:MAG: alpha-L-fucosidase [Bryobacteraceae bacterium]
MHRRHFLKSTLAGLSAVSLLESDTAATHRLPKTDSHYRQVKSYVEEVPVPEYRWASPQPYEAFRDMKVGVRVHWGIYSITGQAHESWPYLSMSFDERARYNELYQSWNPAAFDADEWTNLFSAAGCQMFAFTTKHHEGFSMFDTKTRVLSRTNWRAPGGPKVESCDLAYSIMETPFGRDIVKELCEAGHRRNLKIALYFSHPDWYDADFRPYCYHPLRVPSEQRLTGVPPEKNERKGEIRSMAPDPTPAEVRRMMARHRAQLLELLSNYGRIDMLSLDMWLGPAVWPQLRQTIIDLRRVQPDVMLRARGIGNYGDYYTPEGFVPGSKENTDIPWMVIYPLGSSFSYDPHAENYKGAAWIVKNVVDTVAKGGNFQIGVGPDGRGKFHPEAVSQLKEGGRWLEVNGSAIYGTRPRADALWREGDNVRFSRTKDNRFIYVFALNWPGQELAISTVRPKSGSQVRMLGFAQPLEWREDGNRGLVINLPSTLQDPTKRPCELAWAFQIEGRDRT